jgi:hypothetical protein
VKRTTRIVTFSALLIIGGAIGSSTFAQEASSAQSAPPITPPARTSGQQTKPKKIWTNDSIEEVKKPSDFYQDQKEAAATEAAAKEEQGQQQPVPSAKPPDPGVAPPVTLKIPKTVEEANAQIAQARDMLDNFQNLSSNTTDRLSTETDPTVRATLEQKMSLLKFDIETTSSDLKTLEKKRDELESEAKDHSGSPTPARSQP